MYCSSCGTAVTHSLSYCNHCGAKLNGAKADDVKKPSEPFSDSLVWAIAAVFIVGIGSIIGLMAVMKEVLNFNHKLIVAFSVLSFLLLFAIEGVFIWLLVRHMRGVKETGDTARSKEQTTKELSPAQARALPEPLPSVTEQTTRTLEPLYSERKAE